jgi:hypothetical protein
MVEAVVFSVRHVEEMEATLLLVHSILRLVEVEVEIYTTQVVYRNKMVDQEVLEEVVALGMVVEQAEEVEQVDKETQELVLLRMAVLPVEVEVLEQVEAQEVV